MKLIKFKVPILDFEQGQFADMGLSGFTQWVEQLPRANPHISGVQINDNLTELNRTPLRKMNRFDLMEHLLLIVLDTVDGLVTQYNSVTLPLNPKARSVSELSRQLLRELATGYKIVINDMFEARESGARVAHVLQFAIQRAMLIQGRLLLETYRVYAPEPEGIWHDLHTLFIYSEHYRISTQPFEPLKDRTDSALSIKQAYLRNILLSLSNPYHLMQGEAQGLYQRCGRWLSFVKLTRVTDQVEIRGKFLIDLMVDLPPRYVPSDAESELPSVGLVLDLQGLVEVLKTQMDQASAHQKSRGTPITLSERMQRDMYLRIIAALGMRAERLDSRIPSVDQVSLVEGLTACHYYLNGCKAFTPEDAERQWQEKLGVKTKSEPVKEAPTMQWSMVEMGADDEPVTMGSTGSSRASQYKAFDSELDDVWLKANRVATKEKVENKSALNSPQYDPVTIKKRNQSPGGMAMFCPDNTRMKSRVGELIGFSDQRRPQAEDWGVGTVRWLRASGDGGTEVGIMKLAESSLAVATKALKGVGRGSEYIRALMLPRVNPMLEPATLVVPAAIYDIGTMVILNMEQLVLYAELTDVIETTSSFTQYQFKLVQPPAALLNAEAAVSRVRASI